MRVQKTKNGFTLIEVLTALFVFTVGLMAVVQLYSQLVLRGVENKEFFSATALANEGIELAVLVRNNALMSGGGAFDDMPNSDDVCRMDVDSPLDCAASNANDFRLQRSGSPEYFKHAGGNSPTFWRRIYFVRDDKGTSGDATDDEMNVVSIVSWSSDYTFPNVPAVESGSESCLRANKCVEVRTTLSQQ